MSQTKAIHSLRQDLVQCPITALAFYTSTDEQLYVLVGEDAWLKVYDTQEHQLHGQLRIFKEQPIHGISVSSTGDLLIWGAQYVAIVPRSSVELLVHGEDDVEPPIEMRACDWIYDGRVSPYDSERGVLVTAHNEVMPFTIESHEGRPRLVFRGLLFLSRPILYSSTMQWTAPDCVLVVAGTVFGEIVVWKCHLGKDTHRLEVLFVLTGHEGSIFGVAISPEVEVEAGRKQRLLASCSDDRTIRVWDITESPEAKTVEARGSAEEVRETGFGENHNSEAQTTTSGSVASYSRRCLAVAVGHASRIWHVRFACSAGAAGPIEVCSFGEDTTMQRWRLAGSDGAMSGTTKPAIDSIKAYPYTLEHLERTACHNGKHIWSCAVTTDGPGPMCAVTGGADGKVTLLRGGRDAIVVNRTASGGKVALQTFDDVYASLQNSEGSGNDEGVHPATSKPEKDGFLRYAFLSEDHLLISTISGELLLGDLSGRPCRTAGGVTIQQDLQSYNVLKTVAPGIAIIGSTSGRLYAFREEQGLEEIAHLPGKITDVLCIPDTHVDVEGSRNKLRILVTVLGSTQATILTLLNTQGSVITMKASYLPLHMGFVVTSVGVCGDLLLLGSRKGVITVYEEIAGAYVHRTFRNDCKTKGGDAVTSIITLPPIASAEPKYVLTTCRDGKYRIYEVQSSTAGFSLQLRHETTPPLGPMLEGARLVQSKDGDLELIIYGFRSTSFVVWNESRQQEIASVACGGAHRTFDYWSDPTDANKLRFVYTKASAMGIFSQDESSVQVLKQGGHGREIRAVASDATRTASAKYIATGAEDTCIRIWDFSRKNDGTVADMRCLAVMQKHTAGLQALKWEDNGYLLSSAGAEEFFVWKVTTLESEYKGLAVVCEAVYPFRTPDGDLRIMDFDSWTIPPNHAYPDGGILLTMVFSNSVLKTYCYTQSTGFTCWQTGKYTGACLTQVRQILPVAGQTEEVGVITGSTDGVVAVWKPTAAYGREEDEGGYRIVLTAQAHENSVKSLEIVLLFADRYYVYTGGDDNALCIHALTARLSDGGAESATGARVVEYDFEESACARVRGAHAAAITGVKALRNDLGGSFLATVSNDQRLKIWRVEASEPVVVQLLYNSYSALADPGGLEIIDDGNLMVAGVGMEIWDFYRGRKLEVL
ncbi:WD40 repeat-like protein [Coniochaeta ligniaria NRRL 30616]|uniref:WD40 repeat-like protein n=1 Tax=Coniochaeta ligniaria NRRL 30616 TaxID=1408157 RepID=A0A1J7ISI7_9PEZI|nr:WD40 repeat-like protein [Coniochaeta ligniaria NRRL 30616]